MPHAVPSVNISGLTAIFTLVDDSEGSACPIDLKYVTYSFHPQFNNVLHRHPDSVYPSGMVLPSAMCLHPRAVYNASAAGFANDSDTTFVTNETYLEYLDDDSQAYYVASEFSDLNLRGGYHLDIAWLQLIVTEGSVVGESIQAFTQTNFPSSVADIGTASDSKSSRTASGSVLKIPISQALRNLLRPISDDMIVTDVIVVLKITPAGDSLDSRKFASITHESETGPQLFLQW